MPPVQKPELRPITQVLKELRLARPEGTRSQEEIAYEIRAKLGDDHKITAGAISQIENGRIRPEMRTMEAIAEVLGVEPTIFAEYRLANARAMLDEREVGLDAALDVLRRIEDALGSSPRARRATEAAQQARNQTPTPAVQSAPKKSRAGGGRKNA